MDLQAYYDEKEKRNWLSKGLGFTLVFLTLCACVGFFLVQSLSSIPDTFPLHTDITIEEGLSINAVTQVLAEKQVVRSSLFLYFTLLYRYEDAYVQAGTYSFNAPLSPAEVAEAITTGKYRSPLISITLPEGFQAKDIYQYIGDALASTSPELFIPFEGYLFPDTYFVKRNTTPEELRTLLTDTSAERYAKYTDAILASGFSKEQVIILASILEREAKDVRSKQIVSGILQNRLAEDMPLQVDATFDYVLDKRSDELTMDDLQLESPYNTYTKKGLPPTPISNPGIESIEAVLYPERTDFLYYLTAPDGTFYYAKTFEEHKKNKARYLR